MTTDKEIIEAMRAKEIKYQELILADTLELSRLRKVIDEMSRSMDITSGYAEGLKNSVLNQAS